MQLGVLVSGNLGLIVLKQIIETYSVSFVLTDKQSTSIIDYCTNKNINYFAGNPRKENILEKLSFPDCDLIVSVNYLFIIEKILINYPKLMAINFHGSILPKYRGRTPHVWAIINNETKTGITSHKIDAGCDTGEIITQKEIAISNTDTGYSILQKFEAAYPNLVIETIDKIQQNQFSLTQQNNLLATYFGKRSPKDGLINWNWQKERIYNWVRAQAKPYPGAFSFINNKKIIIHKIEFVEIGYHYEQENGNILFVENNNPVIKTPNGCVKLIDFEFEDASFIIGNTLV